MGFMVWSTAKKLLLLVSATLLTLLILEISLRIYNPIESRLRGDRIVLPVRKTYIFENIQQIVGLDQTIIHKKNSLGFRGPEPPPDSDSDFSIIAVGGSTTECSLLSEGKTWVDVLAAHLDERFENTWVNNAGLDGHSTFGHTVLVTDILLRIHPDLLLFLIGINDIGLEKQSAHTASVVRGPIRVDSFEGLMKSLAYHSEIVNLGLNHYRLIRSKIRGSGHSAIDIRNLPMMRNRSSDIKSILDEHRRLFIPLFEDRVDNLISICRKNGIDVVLITQPALYGLGKDVETGIDLSSLEISENISGKNAWEILELYNDSTRRIALRRNIFLIDIANELPKNSLYFYDFVHYTNSGAHELGTIVAKHLGDYLSSSGGGTRLVRERNGHGPS